MRMHRLAALTCLLALPFASCTAKYQDIIRDRDETIRDLESQLSSTRGENTQLRGDLAQARSDLASARQTAQVKPASNTKDINDLLKENNLDGKVVASYRRGRLSLGIPSSITFASGSTRITREGSSVLSKLASLIRREFPGKRIYVEGHTDSDPIKKSKKRFRSNRHLSVERADAVATYLSKRGLAESRLVIAGFGPHDPVARGNKSRNRRVEIVVTKS